MVLRYQRTFWLASLLALCTLALSPACACGVDDEIQVYNAEIAKVGQWTLQSHSNYAISGCREADFEGGVVPNHSLNGTPGLPCGTAEGGGRGSSPPSSAGSRGGGEAPPLDQNRQFLLDGGRIRT